MCIWGLRMTSVEVVEYSWISDLIRIESRAFSNVIRSCFTLRLRYGVVARVTVERG